jgi:2-polyprenyl-6-hydroxyphenyl methylase/3-demethylubiquinone-9 3-methyltransferase
LEINSIRPKTLQEGQRYAYMKDVDFYKNQMDLFIDRNCPCCNSKENTSFSQKDGFKYSQCRACYTIYMNPGPPKQVVEKLYEISQNYQYWSKYIYPISKEARMKSLHSVRSMWVFDSLIKEFPDKKNFSILEIGAGTGDTLRSLLDSFPNTFSVTAFEPNPSMNSALEENGISQIRSIGPIMQNPDSKYDAILGFEVLEHLLDPLELMIALKHNLKVGGLFLATTPNSQSLEVQFLKEKSTTLDIEHITLLSSASVHALARLSGLSVLEITTPGELDLELMSDSSIELSVLRDYENTSKSELQKMISQSGLSSHQRLILKKA